jgi:hypothetical protein
MRALLLIVPLAIAASDAVAQDWFTDDFNDGVIDGTHWDQAGNVTESGGFLNLDRDDPDDYVRTDSTYAGNYVVELDIRLASIHWNDMFHGIAITDDAGVWGGGVSFGYSRYGKLYLAVHDSGGFSVNYYYGPDGSNQQGSWLHWRLETIGTDIIISVNGTPISWGPPAGTIYVPDGAAIRMPGDYEDGDGGPHVGTTSSDVDLFSVTPTATAVDEVAIRESSWGGIKNHFR